MRTLDIFPNGTRVRHEAYIQKKKLISTLFGTITDGCIVTDGLGTEGMRFKQPIHFIKAHKEAKIKKKSYQTIHGNPWKIMEYWDAETNSWQKLSEFKPSVDAIPSSAIQADSESISTMPVTDEYDSDAESFVTCISELDSIETSDNSHFKLTWDYIDTVEVWQWKLWISNEYLDSCRQIYLEYIQDEANLDEIEAELDYEAFSRAYPWITHYNLPHEEETWIALRANLPCGEVWIDTYGNCWEVVDNKDSLATAGKWIGKWSWETNILDLQEKEPGPLVDDEQFWDIIQDFDEPV